VAARRGAVLALTLVMAGCATKGFVVPAGPGTPTTAADPVFAAWSKTCAAIDTLTVEAGLSGQVERGKVRGRLHAGLTKGGGVRLEAVAPFGPPLFTLAGHADRATLWLPRDSEVVRDETPAAIVDALAGVALSPGDLLAVMTGWLGAGDAPGRAEQFAGLTRVSTGTGIDTWWRLPGGAARPVAIVRGELQVEYLELGDGAPNVVRLTRRSSAGAAMADLRLSLAQRETNVAIDPAAFRVDVPPDARAISLDDLRRAGLFGSR